jgi:hypothetical protein
MALRAYLPDVRLGVQTDDGALVLIRYFGRIRLVPASSRSRSWPRSSRPATSATNGSTRFRQSAKARMAADRTRLDYEFYEVR